MRIVVAAVLLLGLSTVVSPQTLQQQYQRYFVRRQDTRNLPEKALNLIGLTSKDVGRSFALIAGVTSYPNMPAADRDLKPATEDLRKLQQYLTTQEFFDEVVVLKDADMSYQNLHYFLEVYFPEQLKRSPRSRFLFAYSGHGITDGNQSFLLLRDARNFLDKDNAINVKTVRTFVDSVVDAGHHVLVLLNACYAGAFLNRPSAPPNYIPQERGAHAITAGGSAEKAWSDPEIGPGSVFFEKVFAGLDGLADTLPVSKNGPGGDGLITTNELTSYLKEEVRISTDQNQHPQSGDISRNGSLGGFFFLNRNRMLRAGIVKEWNQTKLTAFGPDADYLKGREYAEQGNYGAAISSYEIAAANGSTKAMEALGWLYSNPARPGKPHDRMRAIQWFKRASDAGDLDATYVLSYAYIFAGQEDPPQAVRYGQFSVQVLMQAAMAGHVKAMHDLGDAYAIGPILTPGYPARDYTLARLWYEKAVAVEDSESMVDLGEIYEFGRGVPTDLAQAKDLYQRAAALGNIKAQEKLKK